MREALVGDVRVPFTPAQEAERDKQETEWARPRTTAEKAAETVRRGREMTRSHVGRALRAIADLADPTMTDAKFDALMRAAAKD